MNIFELLKTDLTIRKDNYNHGSGLGGNLNLLFELISREIVATYNDKVFFPLIADVSATQIIIDLPISWDRNDLALRETDFGDCRKGLIYLRELLTDSPFLNQTREVSLTQLVDKKWLNQLPDKSSEVFQLIKGIGAMERLQLAMSVLDSWEKPISRNEHSQYMKKHQSIFDEINLLPNHIKILLMRGCFDLEYMIANNLDMYIEMSL